MRILFGPGGSSGQGNIKGIKTVQEKGLGCYEVEFTHGVRMGDDMCQEINDIKDKIKLSTHAPYYINLLSEDKEKILASKKRILDSCNKAHKFGGDYVVFHPAFYGKIEKKDSFSLVENQINELQKSIKENKYNVSLAPETTGKYSQFGDLDELIDLSKKTKCHICVDFAHLYAREQGKIDFFEVTKKLKSFKHLHCHFSGIEFTPKGEKKHLLLTKKFFQPLAEAISETKNNYTIICESPQPLNDALKLHKWYYNDNAFK